MKTIIINASPRGKTGTTWWVLEKFIAGMEAAGETPEVIQLAGKKVHHCTGELACWFKTPGQCIHKDDMDEIIPKLLAAESVIFATPVYVDGMTGILKNFVDRLVPTADPHFEMINGHCRHVSKNGMKVQRIGLISVCGFHEIDNFDPLVAHIKAITRNFKAEYAGAVLRPAAPMFPEIPTIHPLFFKIRAVKKAIEQAGAEFVKDGRISEETTRDAAADIVSKEDYFKVANEQFDKMLSKNK